MILGPGSFADMQGFTHFFALSPIFFVVKTPIGLVVVSQLSWDLPPGSGHLVDGETAVETHGLP